MTLESRDGGVTKDPKILNAVAEISGEGDGAIVRLRRRPGCADLGSVKSGNAQGLFVWNGIRAIIGDYMNFAPISTISSAPTQTNLSPANAGLQFTANYTNATAGTPRLFFKNRTAGWTQTRAGTISTVTYGGSMGAGTYSLISLTRSGATATATLAEDVFNVGDSVTIAGASDAAYNGVKTITAVTAGSVTPAADISITSLTRDNGAVLNSADKDAAVTLSNVNRTATAVSGYKAVRGNVGKSSGKWYWEVTSSGGYVAGVGDASASLANFPGVDVHGWGVVSVSGDGWHNGGPSGYTSAAFSANEVVGFALDMDAGTLNIYRSGVVSGSGFSGITGTIYPMIAPNGAVDVTVNFGATAFTYTAPSGYGSLLSTSATATAVCATAHGLTTSTAYTIAGANQSAYNGSKTVTVLSPTSFTYPVTLTEGGGASISISSITLSGTTATATTAVPHSFTSTSHTISGANQSEYNGSKSITVTGANTFTFTVTTSPATPATGSPSIQWWISGQASSAAVPASNAGSNSPTVTVSTPDGNNLSNGDQIKYDFYGGTAGPNLPSVGTCTVANRTSSGFTFDDSYWSSGNPSGWSGNITIYRQSPPTISSITRSSSTATLTTSAPHNFGTYDWVAITGATQTEYNHSAALFTALPTGSTATYTVTVSPASPATGTITVDGYSPITPATGSPKVTRPTVTVNPTFSYAVAGTPATPDAGASKTAQGNGGTVPGIAYIDGYFAVMDVNGVIWNSNLDDPTTWGATAYTVAQSLNGAGKALGMSQNYLVAYKEWSTELFYRNPDNASGSVFTAVPNGFTRVGCASGDSLAEVAGSSIWISQTKAEGRGVHMGRGLEQQKVSTPDVDRILELDSLATVYAYGIEEDGHPLYILTLTSSSITLVYDVKSGMWYQWSSYTLGSSKTVSSITRDGDIATATTDTAHGLSDGDPVLLAGATQNEYNGIFQVSYVSTTVFQIMVSGSPTTPATGTITAKPYTESYFKFIKGASYQGTTLMLHESDGHIYKMDASLHQDAGLPINWFARTARMDGGSLALKKMAAIEVVGDSVSDVAMVRWSDDDSATFKAYRFIDLSLEQPRTRKCGSFRRRSIEFRHIGNTGPVIQALELEV